MSCFIFLQIREQRDALEDWLDWIQEKEDVYMVTGTQASVAKNTIQIVGNTKKNSYMNQRKIQDHLWRL